MPKDKDIKLLEESRMEFETDLITTDKAIEQTEESVKLDDVPVDKDADVPMFKDIDVPKRVYEEVEIEIKTKDTEIKSPEETIMEFKLDIKPTKIQRKLNKQLKLTLSQQTYNTKFHSRRE